MPRRSRGAANRAQVVVTAAIELERFRSRAGQVRQAWRDRAQHIRKRWIAFSCSAGCLDPEQGIAHVDAPSEAGVRRPVSPTPHS
jgi:hypothetical protein